jgi:hypothetical protein
MKVINLKNEKEFFTKCNANHRYSDRVFVSKAGAFLATSSDLVSGIEWTVYKLSDTYLPMNDDNLKELKKGMLLADLFGISFGGMKHDFTASTITEIKEEIKYIEEVS